MQKNTAYNPGNNRCVIEEFDPSSGGMPSSHWYHILTTVGSDGGYQTQLALGMTGLGVYYRNKNANTYSGWTRLLDSASLNPKTSFGSLHIGGYNVASYIYSEGGDINFRYVDGAGNIQYSSLRSLVNNIGSRAYASHDHSAISSRTVSDVVGVNTIVTRNPQGYSYMNYINCNTPSGENPVIGNFIVTNSSDAAFFRKASPTHVKNTLKVPTFTLSGTTLTISVP